MSDRENENEVLVRTLMTRSVITVDEHASVEQALETMKEKQVRHLPVTSPRGLVGMVSDRDITTALDVALTSNGRRRLPSTGQAMRREIVSIHQDRPAREAARLLAERRIGALPVLDDGGRLVGIVTAFDLLSLVAGAMTRHGAAPFVPPTVAIDALLLQAFVRANASEATTAIERARQRLADEAQLDGFSLEVVVPEGADLAWVEQRLLQPITSLARSMGRPMPACPGLFVSLFAGGEVHCVLAAEVLAWVARYANGSMKAFDEVASPPA